jgi:hypothetical protein
VGTHQRPQCMHDHAQAARRNRDACRQLAGHVGVVAGLLRCCRRPRWHPETRRPPEHVDDASAYLPVRPCSQQEQPAGCSRAPKHVVLRDFKLSSRLLG